MSEDYLLDAAINRLEVMAKIIESLQGWKQRALAAEKELAELKAQFRNRWQAAASEIGLAGADQPLNRQSLPVDGTPEAYPYPQIDADRLGQGKRP